MKKQSKTPSISQINNIVVISDTHFGSTLALMPPGIMLDDEQTIELSPVQKKLWGMWHEFWDWIEERLDGEPFILVHNGDIVDGSHHGTTTVVTNNLTIQQRIAKVGMERPLQLCSAYYQIRGTEAHVGQSACSEESIAEHLGAVQLPNGGPYSRWQLWVELGDELIHFSHHIGTTSSTSYESSAVMREIVAAFVEAGQWGVRPPTMVVRSHRHRYIEVKTHHGRGIVTPAWQTKTPFVFKIDRLRVPHFGGLLIRSGTEGVHVREWLRTVEREQSVNMANRRKQ
jgi:hypothetical protein